MDTKDIELAVEKFFEMCKEHPEICPHDYEFKSSGYNDDVKWEIHYVCKLCGNEKTEIY